MLPGAGKSLGQKGVGERPAASPSLANLAYQAGPSIWRPGLGGTLVSTLSSHLLLSCNREPQFWAYSDACHHHSRRLSTSLRQSPSDLLQDTEPQPEGLM